MCIVYTVQSTNTQLMMEKKEAKVLIDYTLMAVATITVMVLVLTMENCNICEEKLRYQIPPTV